MPVVIFEDPVTGSLPINIPGGVAGLNGVAQVASAQLPIGLPGGVAGLDGGGKVPAAQLPSPLPGSRAVAGIALMSGDIAVGALAVIPGTLVGFTVGAGGGITEIDITGSWEGFSTFYTVQLGVRIDGVTDYYLALDEIGFGGSDATFQVGQSGSIPLSLAPGAHTAQIFAVQAITFGFILHAVAAIPLSISVDYPT